MRDAKALHLRRATVINHVAICERRNQDLQQARDAQLSKMEEANTKHQEKVQANQDAVQRLLQSAEKEGQFGETGCPCYSDESNLEYCTMQDFGKLTCPMLKAFIVAHHPELKRMKDIPNKGTVKEAEEHNAHNAILMAYKCRMSQNLLEGNMPHSAEDIARMTCEVAEEQDGENVMTVRLEELDLVKPSSLLECPLWRANAVRLFGLQARSEGLRVDPGAEVSEEKKVTANKLVLILRNRFKVFLKQRIKEKARRDHWCMRFALKNLPVVAAALVLSGHVKKDVSCLNGRDSLLVTDSSCYVRCCDMPDKEGAYLYMDTVRQVFVRSGKVAGRGFLDRHKDHLRGAKESRPLSTFYRSYPSELSSRANNTRRGHFESLVQYVAASFDRNSEEANNLDRSNERGERGGVLILSVDEVHAIENSMKNLKCTRIDKFKHILAYQVEKGYDLDLAPGDVVSMNPGFESILWVF